jgi:hypothetical protein
MSCRCVRPRASSESLFQVHSHGRSRFDVTAGSEFDRVYIATELAWGTMPQRPAQFQGRSHFAAKNGGSARRQIGGILVGVGETAPQAELRLTVKTDSLAYFLYL